MLFLFPDERQRIDQAVITHPISGQDIAQLAKILGALADYGINWQDVIRKFILSNPRYIEIFQQITGDSPDAR